MKKRDRGQTPIRASLTAGWSDAVPESTGPSEKMIDTASAFYLDGEGTSRNLESKEDKSKDIARIISYNDLKRKEERKEQRKRTKNNYRVPVLNPDGTPAMPTTSRRANKWIKEKKAKIVKNKFRPGAFAIQLLNKPVGKIRVPVKNPDGSPAMPTLSSRARRWIEEGKVVPKRTKTGIFYVQLLVVMKIGILAMGV